MTAGGPRFTHINDGFNCENCGKPVPPRRRGCRNHCPFCLTSKHVDVNPGDRLNPCQGLMRAVDYEPDPQKGLVLIFRCERCQAITRNVAAYDHEPDAPDDYALILTLGRGKPRTTR